MSELVMHVGRVVGPVRAAPGRKRRMRRELHAHLAAALAEERARLGDDALALHQTLRRFGDPADLTRELQATVPRLERVLFSRGIGGRADRLAAALLVAPGDPPLPRPARIGLLVAALTVFVVLAFTAADGWSASWVGWDVLAVLTAHAFVSTYLGVAFCREVAGRLRPPALLRAAAYGSGVVLSGVGLMAGLGVVQPENPLWEFVLRSPDRLLRVVAVGSAALVVLAVVVRAQVAYWRREREWANVPTAG
jgi:ATP-dependent Clp protease ATP-binding subunit ClpC